jgi:hypothetical protein
VKREQAVHIVNCSRGMDMQDRDKRIAKIKEIPGKRNS